MVDQILTWLPYAVIGMMIMAALLALMLDLPLRQKVFSSLFAPTVCAYVLMLSWGPELESIDPWRMVVFGLTSQSQITFFLLARSIFLDGDLKKILMPGFTIPMAVVTTLTFADHNANIFADAGLFAEILGLVNYGFTVAVAFMVIRDTIRDRSDDLVESRRAFRLQFLALAAGLILIIITAEAIRGTPFLTGWPALVVLTDIMILIALFARHFALEAGMARLDHTRAAPAAPADETNILPTPPALKAVDAALYGRLAAWVERAGFCESELTITALAQQLDSSEHRLRALINQSLGYRNFSAFLNHYRLAEAARRLASPDFAHLPVLTIAMDLGYGSLGPFNRAFKTQRGMTPSEWRQTATQHWGDTVADSGKSEPVSKSATSAA